VVPVVFGMVGCLMVLFGFVILHMMCEKNCLLLVSITFRYLLKGFRWGRCFGASVGR
jgi:hypothetical protein